ncbi:MAG: acyltransferase family protein [Ginsengibacter sp.]
MTSQTTVTKGYIPQLDGIRGLAIILVITFHYWGNIPIFSFGWCGVDLFFVLSGYLITSRLIALHQQKNSLRKFYINRALRILPLYYLTLVIFYVGFNLLVKKQNFFLFNFYNHNWLSFALFFQNWSLIFYNGVKEKFLDHFWSLAVEEQFYLIWPFFLYAFWQKKILFKLIFIIIVLIIITRTFLYIEHSAMEDYKYYFYNSFCRMDGFLIGGCLFLFQKKNKATQFNLYYLPALILIIAGIFFTGNAKGYNPFLSTIGFTLIAVVFAGLIYKASNNSSKLLATIFNYKWLKLTGKISYGLYIFHWLVLRALEPRLENWFIKSGYFSNGTANEISLFLCLAISYTISVASYYSYEMYFLKRKMR